MIRRKIRRFTWWLLNYPLVDVDDGPGPIVVVALGAADVVWMRFVCKDEPV